MSRSKKKRYGVRIDRVAILLVVLVGVVLLLSAVVRSCSREGDTSDGAVSSQQDSKASHSLSSFDDAIERLGFEKRSYSVDDIHYGELILVDGDHEYVFDENKLADNVEVSSEKNDFYGLLSQSILLNSTAVQSLNELMKEYYSQTSDSSVTVSSGYRSKAEQEIVYEQALDNGVTESQAGYSDSHTGYGLDLTVLPDDASMQPLTESSGYEWIVSNCARYGFIQRYPESKQSITGISDPSYFRYVSVPHSLYMQENDLSLEEYVSLLNNYRFGVKALRYTYDDQEYMVYLCEASSSTGTVEVYVPKDKDYTICGNNVNGFIVTVRL